VITENQIEDAIKRVTAGEKPPTDLKEMASAVATAWRSSFGA